MNLEIDLSYLEMLSDGDTIFIITILETFVEETPKDVKKIRIAVDEKNIQEIGNLAHKTKSSPQTLGLVELKQLAFDIEQIAKEKTTDTSLIQTADTFTTHLENAIDIVNQKLTSIS